MMSELKKEFDAKMCATEEEEVFKCPFVRGNDEYAVICWLTLIWVILVPFKNKKKLNKRMTPNYGLFDNR